MKNFCLGLTFLLLWSGAGDRVSAEKNIYVDPQGGIRTEVRDVPAAEYESPEVDLYVTSWCPYCKKALQYFRSRNIPVNVHDVEKDRYAAEEKNRLTSRGGVPFAVINGKRIHGYSPTEYDRALKGR